MAKYKVLERSFLNNRLHEAGDIINYDGTPAANLEPVDSAAKAAVKAAAASGEPLDIVDSKAAEGEAGADGASGASDGASAA